MENPSLFKSNFLSQQLSHLTTVPHIHLAMATKPPQFIKESFILCQYFYIMKKVESSDLENKFLDSSST